MRGASPNRSLKERLLNMINSNPSIGEYLRYMRLCDYYHNSSQNLLKKTIGRFYRHKFASHGIKLGFSIGYNVFGYGLVIPHYGTIVVNEGCKAGNFCVLHTSTCISGGNKTFGDALYMSVGSIITGAGEYGNGVTLAANSVANKPVGNNILLIGSPAVIKRENYDFWYIRDGIQYKKRVDMINELHSKTFN